MSAWSWTIPAVLTLLCLGMMFRPYQRQGDYDFGSILRVFWLLPIGFIWAAYFGVLLLMRG